MIAMTNHEEVAKKLREVGKGNSGWSMTTHAAFLKIDDIIGAQCKSYEFFFNRLADLIDPTCKPCITCESLTESCTKYTSECSNCGAIFGDFPTIKQAETTHPVYCPVLPCMWCEGGAR